MNLARISPLESCLRIITQNLVSKWYGMVSFCIVFLTIGLLNIATKNTFSLPEHNLIYSCFVNTTCLFVFGYCNNMKSVTL